MSGFSHHIANISSPQNQPTSTFFIAGFQQSSIFLSKHKPTSFTARPFPAFGTPAAEAITRGGLDAGPAVLTGLAGTGVDQLLTQQALVALGALAVKHLRVQQQACATVHARHALAGVGATLA